MINDYLGNETYIYTLSTGKEITLTDTELNELMTENSDYKKSSDLQKELDEAVEYIEELEYEKKNLEDELDLKDDEVIKLNIKLEELKNDN